MTGVDVPWSGMQRKGAMSRLLSLVRYSGMPAIFCTLAPADNDSVLILRIAASGTSAPYDVSLPLPTLAERRRVVTLNPVAAAIVYKRMLEAFLECLVGLAPSHLRRRSVSMAERPLGIFGRVVGYAVVTEEQARRSAHAHAVIQTDMSPMLVQRAVDDVELRAELCRRFDTIVEASLPRDTEANATSELPCAEPTLWHRDGRNAAPTPVSDAFGFREALGGVVRATNVHAHTHTCHKGAVGKYKCRLAYPRAPWRPPTTLLQLVLRAGADEVLKPVALLELETRDAFDDDVAKFDPMLAWRDKRVIVVELHRADMNSELADHAQLGDHWCDVAVDGSS